jgi:hypothetical protein
MIIRTPRRCSAPPNTGRNFRSKVSPNSTRPTMGRVLRPLVQP